MDQIPALSTLDLSSQISVKVARKALDAQKEEGAAIVQLIQSAAKVQSETQPGSSGSAGLDLYA